MYVSRDTNESGASLIWIENAEESCGHIISQLSCLLDNSQTEEEGAHEEGETRAMEEKAKAELDRIRSAIAERQVHVI
jgi:hypothetical protein